MNRERKGRIRSFVVSFRLPPVASEDQAIEYIEDAVMSWRGQLHPAGINAGDDSDPDEVGDPMWSLDPGTVVVRARRK